ncbi:response regulator [Methylocystis bryophila]|uniref:Response regulator n=1 Tax=Methylocystis bryophila TaxID=655015 RepID=A0A1W6MUC9_9HYPH|nr:response regulator [Methylocystis bryophila]ARN81213.1 response regulator [Methylocystis bryophila]BDV37159.1 two-component response regulator [Methylocystis bryophila]
MTLSQQIAPYLPYLRRYARALAGSQNVGDAIVVQTLEAIIEEPASFPKQRGARAGLYRVFSTLWSTIAERSFPAEEDLENSGTTSSVMQNVARLTPRSRQAFLLNLVERFAPSDIAFILDVDIEAVSGFLSSAEKEIAECIATDVLIIEDEAVIAAELSMIVRELGHSIIGVARTQTEAQKLTRLRRPGLVLADIHLADGSSGIDAVNDILQQGATPIIFITAYPERLLTGQRPEPTFLISKPYDVEAVKATICQSLFFDQKASSHLAANS